MALSVQPFQIQFPSYAPAGGELPDIDMQLLEECAFDDELGMDFLDDESDSETRRDPTGADEKGGDMNGRGGSAKSSAMSTKKRKMEPKRKSVEQMERRRERSRILARRTRLRKKFFFESLQKQVLDLRRENLLLKDIVKKRMTDSAPALLEKYNTKIPSIVTESMAEATTMLEKTDFNLVKALQMAQQSFVVTDPSLPDNPIVFASQGFLGITGYRMDQVLGRNCRFLQGPDTDPKKVEAIRSGVKAGTDTSVCLLNYRADGAPFWNQFFVAPLRDLNHNVVYYVGAQCVVDKPILDAEVQENQHVTQAIAGRGATYRTVGAAATRSYARVMTRREEKAGEIVADLN